MSQELEKYILGKLMKMNTDYKILNLVGWISFNHCGFITVIPFMYGFEVKTTMLTHTYLCDK